MPCATPFGAGPPPIRAPVIRGQPATLDGSRGPSLLLQDPPMQHPHPLHPPSGGPEMGRNMRCLRGRHYRSGRGTHETLRTNCKLGKSLATPSIALQGQEGSGPPEDGAPACWRGRAQAQVPGGAAQPCRRCPGGAQPVRRPSEQAAAPAPQAGKSGLDAPPSLFSFCPSGYHGDHLVKM